VGLCPAHRSSEEGESNNDVEAAVKNGQKAPKRREEAEKINMSVWGGYEGCFTQEGMRLQGTEQRGRCSKWNYTARERERE
jgi:hypothetical protein